MDLQTALGIYSSMTDQKLVQQFGQFKNVRHCHVQGYMSTADGVLILLMACTWNITDAVPVDSVILEHFYIAVEINVPLLVIKYTSLLTFLTKIAR
jgi:hypothetical protein